MNDNYFENAETFGDFDLGNIEDVDYNPFETDEEEVSPEFENEEAFDSDEEASDDVQEAPSKVVEIPTQKPVLKPQGYRSI